MKSIRKFDIAGVVPAVWYRARTPTSRGSFGYFCYVLDTIDMKNIDDFDFNKQMKVMRMKFISKRKKVANSAYHYALVDSNQLVRVIDDLVWGGSDGYLNENTGKFKYRSL